MPAASKKGVCVTVARTGRPVYHDHQLGPRPEKAHVHEGERFAHAAALGAGGDVPHLLVAGLEGMRQLIRFATGEKGLAKVLYVGRDVDRVPFLELDPTVQPQVEGRHRFADIRESPNWVPGSNEIPGVWLRYRNLADKSNANG